MNRWFQDVTDTLNAYLGISPELQVDLAATLLVILAYMVLRAVAAIFIRRRMKELTRQYAALKTVTYLLGVAVIVALWRIWLGTGTGMAAYLGIMSAGLAIALQDPLTNLAGWAFISVRKPFVVGDRVEIGDHAGDVIDVRLFQFSLVEIGNWVDADQSTGRIIHIPNGWVFKQTTSNYTQGFNFIWNEIAVTVTFESDWRKTKDILLAIGQKHTAIRSEEAAQQLRKAARKYLIFFQYLTPAVWTSVADQGVTVTLRYLCEPRQRRSSATAIWEELLTLLEGEERIDFAYPTQRIYYNPREGKAGTRPAAGESDLEGPA